MALAFGGMAFGRVIGACLERERRVFPTWLFVGVEVALAAGLAALG